MVVKGDPYPFETAVWPEGAVTMNPVDPARVHSMATAPRDGSDILVFAEAWDSRVRQVMGGPAAVCRYDHGARRFVLSHYDYYEVWPVDPICWRPVPKLEGLTRTDIEEELPGDPEDDDDAAGEP